MPAQLANRLATVDQLGGGRLSVIGLSVGWSEEEHRAVGVDPKTLGKRMDDFVPALRACWGDDPVEYHGPVFDIAPAIMRPKPVTAPKLMSGMYSKPGLARTARDFDFWNPGSMPIADVVPALEQMNSQREAGKPDLGAIYRLAQQSTSGKRLTTDEMTTRVRECVAAARRGHRRDELLFRDHVLRSVAEDPRRSETARRGREVTPSLFHEGSI
ncbi:LLM class flavin-dependent oxidoreductase [Rhodococcus jostii]|uniref:LLM class flavin-dependent oxidoreductase n=1 Tax=Rhodococcus jostii TaxID=132919 RepID=UPI0036588A01